MTDSMTLALTVFAILLIGIVGGRLLTGVSRTNARQEAATSAVMRLGSFAAIAITLAIVLSLVLEAQRFFALESATGFLFGTKWSAQTGASFGAVPLFFGTFFVACLAMVFATPIGIFTAIYLAEYASSPLRRIVKPMLEMLAGIPTIVFGLLTLIFVGPFVQAIGNRTDQFLVNAVPGVSQPVLNAEPTSALAAGIVIGIMIIPFIASLADDILRSVSQTMRDGALALGATRSEMMWRVILPAAMPGIVGAFLLAVSRALGDTIIVTLAQLHRPQITANPFSDVTTVTVQIVELLIGDIAFSDSRTLVAFALGLTLFVATLFLNLLALRIVRRFRDTYA